MTVSGLLAMGFSLAIWPMGSAMASSEVGSFTDRVQEWQNWTRESAAAREERMRTQGHAPAPSIPLEAESFITRVEKSQGIQPSDRERTRTAAAPSIPLEAESFITRVEVSQGIGTGGEMARA